MAVKQKYAVHAAVKKTKNYFKAKAKLKDSAQRRARKNALRAQKRAIAKAVRAQQVRIANKVKKMSKVAALRARKNYEQKAKAASGLSSYFVAQDIISEQQFVGEKERMNLSRTIAVPSRFYNGLEKAQGRKSQTRLENMIRSARIFMLRIIAMFSKMGRQAELTISGKKALRHLEDLYNLLSLDAPDDDAKMRLKLAYGEANYYVNRASQGYYQKHKGKGSEKYQDYFKRFIESSPDKL
jgi:hypothetical protein